MQNIADIGYLKVGASVALCAALAFGLGWRYFRQTTGKSKSRSTSKIKEKRPSKGYAGSTTRTGASSDADESQQENDLRGMMNI
jgi:hypothetical protein